MRTEKERFSNIKSEWKRQCKAVYRNAEQVQRKARAGDIITLGDVFSVGHKIRKLGDKAQELADRAISLGMSERVLRDIGNEAHYLEVYSAGLKSLLHKRRMYTNGFPLYQSTLDYTILLEDEELDPIESLEQIMRGSNGKE